MIVAGTVKEINAVLQAINPGFPYQNLENAGSECCYVFGGVNVTILTVNEEEKNESNAVPAHERQN